MIYLLPFVHVFSAHMLYAVSLFFSLSYVKEYVVKPAKMPQTKRRVNAFTVSLPFLERSAPSLLPFVSFRLLSSALSFVL